MRKREFVGITVIGGIVCFICCLLGRNREFEKGYKDFVDPNNADDLLAEATLIAMLSL